MDLANSPEQLTSTYRRIGVLSGMLHETCPSRQQCWDAFGGPQKGPDWNELTFPWIGKDYPKWRILVCAINMWEYGGRGAISEELVPDSKHELELGKVRTGTTGTMLYHRVAAYSSLILRRLGHKDFATCGPEGLGPKAVAPAYDCIAHTNYVKCSPAVRDSPYSNPSKEMLSNCGRLIFSEELSVLSPRVLVLLGTDIPYAIRAWKSQIKPLHEEGGAKAFNMVLNDQSTLVLALPHPSRTGVRLSLFSDVDRLLNTAQLQDCIGAMKGVGSVR
jgi:hypothetical protein